MALLLMIFGPAALFLALQLLWDVPRWLNRRERLEATALPPELDPFALPFIRHRLGVLADELTRLEDDPTVYAKAFRTQVAQAAYRALVEDESRLSAVAAMEMELCLAGSLKPLREELEL